MASSARVAVVLLAQLAVLAAVPARQVRARLEGELVTLRTGPVDPFDAFAGHYVTLSYEVEQIAPRADAGLRNGDEAWLTVAQGDPAWSFVSLTRERPAPASGQVSIRVRFRSHWQGGGWGEIEGASRFYVTEGRGAAIDAARRGRQPALVDLRIGPDGTPSIVALRAAGLVLRDR